MLAVLVLPFRDCFLQINKSTSTYKKNVFCVNLQKKKNCPALWKKKGMTIYASMRKSTDNNIKTEVYECPSHLKNHHEDERDRDFFPEAVEL